MNDELKKEFVSATETEKIAMLLAFAVHLTILIRGEHKKPHGNSEAFNETVHRIVSQALGMVAKSGKKYPDDVFIEMLFAGAAHKGITPILEQAFAQAKSMTER
jgi:hypothetical protein